MKSIVRSSLLAFSLAGAVAAATACSAAPVDDADSSGSAATEGEKVDLLDVNDVSILFGLRNGKPFPEMSVVGDGLLPKSVLDQITSAATKLTPAIDFSSGRGDDASKWRVFGMRFDPCAPGINTAFVGGDLSKCSVQVRLIAQPLGASEPQDVTMHIVFTIDTLDKANLEDFRADLMKIKVASAAGGAPTAGQPLGVHPGLAKGDAATANAVTAFIKKYAPKQKSTAIAFMGLQNDGAEPWQFFAGAVVPVGGTPTFLNLKDVPNQAMPNLPPGSTSEVFQPFGSPKVSPSPARLNTSPLFEGGGADASNIAFQVEDPAKTHFFSTDCVSCHTSTQMGFSLQTKSNATRRRVPAGITGYVSPSVQQNSSWNLRNFGYFSTSPSVSLRTVNETVEVVQLVNKNHHAKSDPKAVHFEGPGNDCTNADDAVFDCFRANTDGKGGATCMTSNKCTPFPLNPPAAPRASVPVSVPPLADPAKDPCRSAADASSLDLTSTTITISGDANQCFSRTFGAFRSTTGPAVSIVCAIGSDCKITVPDTAQPTVITGVDAARLDASISKGSTSHTFTANTKDGELTIACTSTCVITPPAQR